MDVTAAKRAEQSLQTSLSEKQALLKEVHHRVKNNLQLLSSLLSLQAGRTKDQAVAELFADSRNRVRSMALVHENLYRAGDFGKVEMAPHIQNLCAHLTRVYAVCDRPIDLIVQIGECHMDLDRAVSCGLLVNELVSNALKHAFPDGRRGHICVELRSSPGGLHELVVSDDGVGLAPDVTVTRGESLGLQLVGALTKQLRGNIRVDRASGTKFSIAFGSVSPAAGAS
jgi:two-component sensor histidine kinase